MRTLHHWDAVGLLTPSSRSTSGYRDYSPTDLERLRQVLTYRELRFGLEEVRALLDPPSVDALAHLRRQQSLLADRIAQLQAVAALVHRAVEAKQMGIDLDPQELQEVFGEQDPTQWADEAQERWGETDAWRESHRRTSSYDKQDWLRVKAEGEQVERRFVTALQAGLPADAPEVRQIAEDHRQQVSRDFCACDHQMHVGLARCTSPTSGSPPTTRRSHQGWRSTSTTRRRTPRIDSLRG